MTQNLKTLETKFSLDYLSLVNLFDQVQKLIGIDVLNERLKLSRSDSDKYPFFGIHIIEKGINISSTINLFNKNQFKAEHHHESP